MDSTTTSPSGAALDKELEELERIIVSLEELEDEIDRDYGENVPLESTSPTGKVIPEFRQSEGPAGGLPSEVEEDGYYEDGKTNGLHLTETFPTKDGTSCNGNHAASIGKALAGFNGQSDSYCKGIVKSEYRDENGLLSSSQTLPQSDENRLGKCYSIDNSNRFMDPRGHLGQRKPHNLGALVSPGQEDLSISLTNDLLWGDLSPPEAKGPGLRDHQGDITSSMEIQVDSDSDKVMPSDDHYSEGISDRSDDLSDTDYTDYTDHSDPEGHNDEDGEDEGWAGGSEVGGNLTKVFGSDSNGNNNDDVRSLHGEDRKDPTKNLDQKYVISALDPYLVGAQDKCLAITGDPNPSDSICTKDNECNFPFGYSTRGNIAPPMRSDFRELIDPRGNYFEMESMHVNGNIECVSFKSALEARFKEQEGGNGIPIMDTCMTTKPQDHCVETEEGVLEPRRRGTGEQEEDGPEHEQLGGHLILQGSLTESPACPEDTHQEELGVTEGNGLTNCETKDSPAIPTKEEGLREGDNPPDDPHSLGSTPGQDNSIQDQEGDTGQQGEDTMGKSSRAPSPKKLVVDEVLPPDHPMPPPPRHGGLRSAIPTPSSSAKSGHTSGSSSKSGIPTSRRTPTPVLEGRMSPRQSTPTPSAWCDACLRHLVDLKRQALRMYKAYCNTVDDRQGNTPNKDFDVVARIEEKLHLADGNSNPRSGGAPWRQTCEVCQTSLSRLKQEAINMVQSLDRTKADSPIPPPSSGIPSLQAHQPGVVGGKNGVTIMPRTTPHYSSAHHRLVRGQGARGSSSHGGPPPVQPPVDPKQYAWASAKHKHINQMLANSSQLMNGSRGPTTNGDINGGVRSNDPYAPTGGGPHSPNMNGGPSSPSPLRPGILPLQHYGTPDQRPQQCLSPASTTSNGSGTSAAASFFARAAQKLNISSRKKRKHHGPDCHDQPYPTNFCEIIHNNPPPAPPVLLRNAGRPTNPGTGKVKVMLRICPVEAQQGSFLSLDARRKQVTVYDPSINGYTTSAHRARGVVAAPKMFAFDTIFSQDDSLFEMCAAGLTDIIEAVVNGADGCLFCYGHARLGKTYTMLGVDDHPQNMGVIPCALAWLFKLINEQKEKTGARFSVRVSAVEVTGKQEQLKDLLVDVAHGMEAGSGTAPGVYLREDPICGTQLENQSELRAPTADRAAHYLDAAVAARTVPEAEEDARNSHMLFTLHVYQYRVEKGGRGNGVAGGRSRLHLVDLGSCSKSKDGSQALSLSALGNVILALLNGQRHVPHRESKLTQLMRDSLGNLSCRTCMIAHVSPAVHAYNETLQVIQLAARIHRMKRRRTNKFSSTSSESGSSCDESGHMRRRMRVGIRMGTLREDAMSMSDPDYTSSSEQSCDTVIYCGPNGQPLSDRELTDNEGPPRMVPVRPRMGRSSHLRPSGSRSSGDESSSSQGDFRLGKPPMPKCGTMANSRLPLKAGSRSGTPMGSLIGSPSRSLNSMSSLPAAPPGVVQLPRKINLKGKQQTVNGHDPSIRAAWSKGPYREPSGAGSGPEQWIDGPGAPRYSSNPQSQGEQWVDGPDAHGMLYKPPPLQPMPPAGEQWIDGPVVRPPPGAQWVEQPVYHHHQLQQPPPPPQLPPAPDAMSCSQLNGNSEHWVDGPGNTKRSHGPLQPQVAPSNKAIPASEQWVDGPMEFQLDAQSDPRKAGPRAERPTKMWTEMSKPASPVPQVKPAPPPRGMSLLKQEEQDSDAPMVAGIQPTIEQPQNAITKPVLPLRNPVLAQVSAQSQRPTSQSSESCTSIAAQVSDTDSRPTSMAGIEVSNMELASNSQCPVPSATEPQSLPGANVKSFVRDWVEKHSVMPGQPQPSQQSEHDAFNQNLAAVPLNEMVFGKNAVPLDTSSQPSSAHSSPHIKKRLRKGALPPPIEHPMNRTAAWIVSVQHAGTETEDMMISPPSDDLQDATTLAPECDQDRMRKTGPPPTYEDCMEDGEAAEMEELEVVDQECQVSIHTAENEEEELAQGGIVSRPITTGQAAGDIAPDMSENASVDNNEDLDISNLLISNRESIYELQMDETLECSRGPDGSWPNTFTSEDDASSSASLPRKNEDVCEFYEVMHEVENVEIPSPSHYDEGVVGDLLVNMEKGARGIMGYLPPDPQMSPLSVNADNESGIASSNGEHLSPPSSSSDSDKVAPGRKIVRPTSLRRPDGASNPNLCLEETVREIPEHEVISEKSLSSPEPLAKPVLPECSPSSGTKSTVSEEAEPEMEPQSPVRSEGVGQGDSPEEEPVVEKVIPEPESPQQPPQVAQDTPSPSTPPAKTNSKLPFKSGIKPPVPVRTSSKLSLLAKPSSKSSSSSSSSAAAPPSSSSTSKSPTSNSKTPNSTSKSPESTSKSPASSSKSPKAETSKSLTSKSSKPEKSASPSRSLFRFGSKSKIAKSTASKPATSPKSSSPTKPTSPSSSSSSQSKANKEKSNKLSQKIISPGSTSSNLSRPASVKSVPSSVQSTTSRLTSSLSKLPTSSKSKDKDKTSPTKPTSKSKIPSPGKKDSKLPVSKVSNSRVSELNGGATCGRATDSDSGNDSGIVSVKNEKKKKLLSPYSTVTKPRNSTHSSSGHGSDNSSTFSGHLAPSTPTKKGTEAHHSSGYESMLRDSEATGSSSTQDSTSEGSCSGRTRGPKIFKKKISVGTRRSRSAPPRTSEEPETSTPKPASRHASPSTPVRAPLSPGPRAWVDTRQMALANTEPIEITVYDQHDVERMQRRRKEDAEMRAVEKRRARVRELVAKQEHLKQELADAKDMLMIDRNTWSYDLYVAEQQMDRDDPNYLEALEKETSILEKRVEACKSRIMMVTCFDMGV